ncbi:MAG: DUF721 domain-containing protein [Candidatus Margulisiibacteriota bacterium]|jgi:hypothetical protein
MQTIGTILQFVKARQVRKAERFLILCRHWNQIFPDNLANNCQPVSLKNKTLVLTVSGPVWRHKLSLEKAEILKQVNKYKILIDDVEFVLSSPKETLRLKAEHSPAVKPTQPPKPVQEPAQEQSLEKIAEKLKQQSQKIAQKRQEKGWQKCAKCAKLYPGGKNACPSCSVKEEEAAVALVRQGLRETPWARYENSGLKTKIAEKKFHAVKEQLLAETRDGLAFYVLHPDQRKDQRDIDRQIRQYVSLRTGVSPAEMTNEIIRKTLGSKFTDILNGKNIQKTERK